MELLSRIHKIFLQSPPESAADLALLLQDLRSMAGIELCFSGVSSDADATQLQRFCSLELPDCAAWHRPVNALVCCSLLLLLRAREGNGGEGGGKRGSSTSSSRHPPDHVGKACLQSIRASTLCPSSASSITPSSPAGATGQAGEKAAYLQLVQAAFMAHSWKLSASHRASIGASRVSAFPAWICLLCARVMFLVFYDYRAAMAWARRAASQLPRLPAPQPPGAPESNPVASTSSSAGVQPALSLVLLESLPAEVEAVLLIAELHEHCGNLEAALSYQARASQLAESVSGAGMQAMAAVVQLHSVRMWQRTSSARLGTVVQDALTRMTTQAAFQGSDWATLSMTDETTRKAHEAMQSLVGLFHLDHPGEEEDGEEHDDAFQRLAAPCAANVQDLQFRFIDKIWDVETVSAKAKCPANGSKQLQFHCCIPDYVRQDVSRLARGCSAESARQVVAAMHELQSFDVLRYARRRCCYLTLAAIASNTASDTAVPARARRARAGARMVYGKMSSQFTPSAKCSSLLLWQSFSDRRQLLRSLYRVLVRRNGCCCY